MAITWKKIQRQVRLTLGDIDAVPEFNEEHMLMAARWSLTEIAMHTAIATSISYTTHATAYEYPLPRNMVDPLYQSGVVAYEGVNYRANRIDYLEPQRRIPGHSSISKKTNDYRHVLLGYYEDPNQKITLSFKPDTGGKIEIFYFSFYDDPYENIYSATVTGLVNGEIVDIVKFYDDDTDQEVYLDDFEFPIERWMEKPLVYFICAYMLDPSIYQTSDLRRWNRNRDSGNPEHNPLMNQAKYFLKRAREDLYSRPPQNRQTYFEKGRY